MKSSKSRFRVLVQSASLASLPRHSPGEEEEPAGRGGGRGPRCPPRSTDRQARPSAGRAHGEEEEGKGSGGGAGFNDRRRFFVPGRVLSDPLGLEPDAVRGSGFGSRGGGSGSTVVVASARAGEEPQATEPIKVPSAVPGGSAPPSSKADARRARPSSVDSPRRRPRWSLWGGGATGGGAGGGGGAAACASSSSTQSSSPSRWSSATRNLRAPTIASPSGESWKARSTAAAAGSGSVSVSPLPPLGPTPSPSRTRDPSTWHRPPPPPASATPPSSSSSGGGGAERRRQPCSTGSSTPPLTSPMGIARPAAPDSASSKPPPSSARKYSEPAETASRLAASVVPSSSRKTRSKVASRYGQRRSRRGFFLGGGRGGGGAGGGGGGGGVSFAAAPTSPARKVPDRIRGFLATSARLPLTRPDRQPIRSESAAAEGQQCHPQAAMIQQQLL
ncbi:LOW QUALITY PROTEIN: hypothetical protein CRUP_008512 [Coryphaenoides rupestris]|nr:LOW QUALITY PROTEIN: hypothetical protein CRUP_008512 [Coryphaenoides rupestris]